MLFLSRVESATALANITQFGFPLRSASDSGVSPSCIEVITQVSNQVYIYVCVCVCVCVTVDVYNQGICIFPEWTS